jgi:subtilase family serine protease
MPYLAGGEEVTDTEMVHAVAPGASLDVILTPPDTAASPATFAAVITKTIHEGAAQHAAVISISASVGEHFLTHAEVTRMHTALEHARDQHVTIVTSSGDSGPIATFYGPPVQVSMPTSDPLVLGVGGTILDATPGGRYLGEMAWDDNTEASGGGYSTLFPRPSYQRGLPQARATRGVPDVSANADPSTAMALALVAHGHGELRASGGTSSSTPLWAGVIALADQQAGRHLGFVNPALYAIARRPAYHRACTTWSPATTRSCGPPASSPATTPGPAGDPVTGLGSPDAQYLVPLLARTARSGA